MSKRPDHEAIARRIKAAQDRGSRLEPVTAETSGFSLSDAYEVARRIHEARIGEGAVPVGRKIGFTNSGIWPQYGVHAPIWGYVYDTTVTEVSGGRTSCRLGAFVEPKIEPEVVLHFAEAPPADSGLDAILECIDWVAPAFEVVQSHYPGWRFQAADTVADSALHGALLVGKRLPVGELGDDPVGTLESFRVDLSRDGVVLDTGKGSNVLGGPVKAAAHLIAALAEPPGYPPLAAGEMVTTGTLTAACPVQAAERWSSEFSGIGLEGFLVEFGD